MSAKAQSKRRYQALIQLLRTADTIWNASRLFFERWDLSPSQFNVLNLLYSERFGLSQAELSRQLIMHRSNVTGLVDRLEHRRLVARQDVAADRRAYRVVLTPAGKRLVNRILPAYHKGARRVWDGFSMKAIQEAVATFHRVSRNAEWVASEPPGRPKSRSTKTARKRNRGGPLR
jgi:DNA-binding MarR family transcriptional regulator